MKQLIRKLSRVGDSSQYGLLRSDFTSKVRGLRHVISFRGAKIRRSSAALPVGYVPIYVGEEMERFVVRAKLLNHPIFVGLLNESAQEYGYDQKGALRIPCQITVFERVLEALRLGGDAPPDLRHLIAPESIDIDDSFY